LTLAAGTRNSRCVSIVEKEKLQEFLYLIISFS
jgi:hypothetical protein